MVKKRDAPIEHPLDAITFARNQERDVAHVADHILERNGFIFFPFMRHGDERSGA